jgi:UDP-glucose-4-epimerase GalE
VSRILVTGGAGYIGSLTCKELNRRGFEVVVYDNLSNSKASHVKWGRLIEGDVCDHERLLSTVKDVKPAGVFHFAGAIEVGESKIKPMKYYKNNVLGTYNLIDCMNQAGVNHVVFSSTCATYGNVTTTPLNEDLPQNPISNYGDTKLVGEKMFRAATETTDLCAVMLRYFNAAGADPEAESGECHNPETHLIPLVIRATKDPSFELAVFGDDYPTPDGTCIRDYTHVTDLAVAHANAMEWSMRTKTKFDAFNLGSGKGSSVLEIIKHVETFTGRKVKYSVKGRREGDPAILVADIAKARRVLDWSPKFGIDAVVRTACAWHESH